jgi:hypothetical protein
MKRDDADYSLEDVQLYVAAPHGCTLPQVMTFDFPTPDYSGPDDEPFWAFDTITAWLERFHTALLVVERASDPEGFARFIQSLQELMARDGRTR